MWWATLADQAGCGGSGESDGFRGFRVLVCHVGWEGSVCCLVVFFSSFGLIANGWVGRLGRFGRLFGEVGRFGRSG